MSSKLKLALVIAALMLLAAPRLFAAETVKFKESESGLYRDVFDQNIYYEGTNWLNMDRFYRDVFGKKVRSKNVNAFDEVPDSTFFTNRHSRNRLAKDQLQKGFSETSGPDVSGDLEVVKGKFSGLTPGFYVRDVKGDVYLFKFDPVDYFEMATAAEMIASRFFHAIGYNVPQYTIASFPSTKLKPAADAMVFDTTGFKKKLTRDRLDEFMIFIPTDEEGNFRASASKLIAGKPLGPMDMNGRRKNDPNDPVDHKDRREIRALPVFSSWLNNFDVRSANTLDVLVNQGGEEIIKHYIIDFNSSLGAGTDAAKAPMIGHEHLMDNGETLKAFFTLGLWEKPWQKRWRLAGEQVQNSPAVGYFDNRGFDPGKFKTQLPHFAFKDMTRADAFWAAKIIMSFTNEDIRAIVETGKYANPEDAEYISATLSERRDIIGRYWFDRSNPLDDFDLQASVLVFNDLAVAHHFYPAASNTYFGDVYEGTGKDKKKIGSFESAGNSIDLAQWLEGEKLLTLKIFTKRAGWKEPSPCVLVELNVKGIWAVIHQD